jgi:hypothetical protein
MILLLDLVLAAGLCLEVGVRFLSILFWVRRGV